MNGRRVVEGPTQLPTTVLSGLPLALVLTNPAFEDNPIVFANAAFARLTGYTIEATIGRNCRFLQGPATEPERVARDQRGRSPRGRTSPSRSPTTAPTARRSSTA